MRKELSRGYSKYFGIIWGGLNTPHDKFIDGTKDKVLKDLGFIKISKELKIYQFGEDK